MSPATPQVSAIWVLASNDPVLFQAFRRYCDSLSTLPYQCELIVVDNGVGDDATARLVPVLEGITLPVKVVRLHHGVDEGKATFVGIREVQGERIVVLPSYLQVDPDALAEMLDKINEGFDYVASWRNPRVDSTLTSTVSFLFNRITSYLSGIRLHDVNSGLRVMRRCVVDRVPVYGDLHRFLPVLAAHRGYRITEKKVRHLEERVGSGDYRLGVYFRRMLDLLALFFLIKFTQKPFRFFGLLGGGVVAIGSGIVAVLGIERVLGTPLSDRPLLILGVLLMVLGAQLFSLGLLGELIIFTYARQNNDHHAEEIYRNQRDH